MNDKKRKLLDQAVTYLELASDLVEDVKDDEQDCFDNLPEGLQVSERGEAMEAAVDALDSALDSIREATEYIGEARG